MTPRTIPWKAVGVAIAAVMFIVIGWAQFRSAVTEPVSGPPVSTAGQVTTPSTTRSRTTGSDADVSPSTIYDRAGLLAVGRRFATDFTRTDRKWAYRLARSSTLDLARKLRTVDVANVPEAGTLAGFSVTGPGEPVAVLTARYSSGLSLDITAVWGPDSGWLVMSYDRSPARLTSPAS